MEQEKKLSYNFYDKALVEKAEDYSQNAYPEYMFDSDCKFFEMLNKKALAEKATEGDAHEDYKLLLKEAQERMKDMELKSENQLDKELKEDLKGIHAANN